MDKTRLDRIVEDANKLYRGKPDSHHPSNYKYIDGYTTGATAENERAQPVIDALAQFIARHEGGLLPDRFTYEKGVKALEQWKDGKKEVGYDSK